MTRFWDGRADGPSDPTPRPAFACGDAGENRLKIYYRVEILKFLGLLLSLLVMVVVFFLSRNPLVTCETYSMVIAHVRNTMITSSKCQIKYIY